MTEVASATVKFKGDLTTLTKTIGELKGRLTRLGKHRWARNISKAAKRAGSGIMALAKNTFYLKEVLGLAAKAARAVADAFIQPAMALERQNIALKAMAGSGKVADQWLTMMADHAYKYGESLEEVQSQATALYMQTGGDIDKAKQQLIAMSQIKTIAPQLPFQRRLGSIEAVMSQQWARAGALMDMPVSYIKEIAKALGFEIGELEKGNRKLSDEVGKTATYITTSVGNAKKTLSIGDVSAFFAKMGASEEMMAAVADSMGGKLQDLKNHWLEFRQTVGTKVLDALAGPLNDLLIWLEDNEEMVLNMANAFGNFLGDGIKAVVKFLSEFDWEAFAETMKEIVEALKELLGLDVKAEAAEGVSVSRAPVVAAKALFTGQALETVKASGWGQASHSLDVIGEKFRTEPSAVGKAFGQGLGFEDWVGDIMGVGAAIMSVPGGVGRDLTEQAIRIIVTTEDDRFNAYVDQRAEDAIFSSFEEVGKNFSSFE